MVAIWPRTRKDGIESCMAKVVMNDRGSLLRGHKLESRLSQDSSVGTLDSCLCREQPLMAAKDLWNSWPLQSAHLEKAHPFLEQSHPRGPLQEKGSTAVRGIGPGDEPFPTTGPPRYSGLLPLPLPPPTHLPHRGVVVGIMEGEASPPSWPWWLPQRMLHGSWVPKLMLHPRRPINSCCQNSAS